MLNLISSLPEGIGLSLSVEIKTECLLLSVEISGIFGFLTLLMVRGPECLLVSQSGYVCVWK